MKTKSEILLMESRMHGDMHVRFGGRLPKTYHREMARRWGSSLLKQIATICGINKTLTTHTARRTFGTTITLANGVSLSSVSSMMGHTSVRMTQRYAKVMESTILREMQGVEEALNRRNGGK